MGKIYIEGLKLQCIIGVHPKERKKKQPIILDICLNFDTSAAEKSDELEDTVDYQKLVDTITIMITNSEYWLIEALAAHVLDICLDEPQVKEVTVRLHKPKAINKAQSISVELTKKR